MLAPLSFMAVAGWLLVGLAIQARACRDQWRHLAVHAVGDGAQRAAAYGRRRALFQWLGALEQVMRVAVWVAAGGLLTLHAWVAGDDATLFNTVVFTTVFIALDSLLREGLTFARWRWVERACGVSTMGLGGFAADAARRVGTQTLIGAAAGGWILWPLLFVATAAQWALSGVLLLLGAVALYWVRPQLIEPLFHRFTSLPPGELRDRLDAMMRRCGGRLDDVRVMDTSRRSRMANAHFAGLGRRKRVVLSDTLIERLEPAELEAVMAHELGHFRCGHLRRYYGLQAALLFGGYLAFGVLQPLVAEGVAPAVWAVAAYIVLPALAWPLQPALARMRRRFEYEADAFSAAHAERAALISALDKLLANNLGSMTMAPAYARRYATHPPADERLARLKT